MSTCCGSRFLFCVTTGSSRCARPEVRGGFGAILAPSEAWLPVLGPRRRVRGWVLEGRCPSRELDRGARGWKRRLPQKKSLLAGGDLGPFSRRRRWIWRRVGGGLEGVSWFGYGDGVAVNVIVADAETTVHGVGSGHLFWRRER